jgi:peptide/nickel transport system substrate-binding protein
MSGIILIALLVSWSYPAQAQSVPKRGGTIRAALSTDLTKTDPHATGAAVDGEVLQHVVETLVNYGKNMEIVPLACMRWEVSDDYRVYTYYLLKGKKFHNGKEMTAEDVKYSLDRMMDPKTGNPRIATWKPVDRVEVVDKYTVKVYMKQPFATFNYVLASLAPIAGIVPKGLAEEQGGSITHPIGTGPYEFVEWKPDRYILLKRFEGYTGQPGPRNGMGGSRIAYLDQIKFIPIGEESVRTMALLNKEIDMDRYFPMTLYDKYQKDYKKKGLMLDEVTGMSWYLIHFGLKAPIVSDINFRKACAYATDIKVLTQAACFGHASANPSIIPRANAHWTPYDETWYPKDLEKARQYLKKSGYNGEMLTISTTKKYIFMYRIAVALQSELEAIGVKTKLNVMEWPTLLQKYNDRDFQILSWGYGAIADPTLAYEYLRNSDYFEIYPQMTELLDQANKTADLEKRQKIFEQCHKMIYETVPCIMVMNYNYLQAYWNYVKGYEVLPTGVPRLWGVWLDK